MQKVNETQDHFNQDGGQRQDAQEIQGGGESSFWRWSFTGSHGCMMLLC